MQILLDPHVHLYPNFDLLKVWRQAFSNFERSSIKSQAYAICLTETESCNFYSELSKFDRIEEFSIVNDEDHLTITKKDSLPLYIFPGRQINSLEGVEVLSLFSNEALPKNQSLKYLIEKIEQSNALPVINWAPGKWLGKRGSFIKSFLNGSNQNIALGLTSLLPNFLPIPQLAKAEHGLGRPLILGSDSFPQSNEERLIGSCGLSLKVEKINSDSIKLAICTSTKLDFFGKRDSLANITRRIIRNELSRRMR